MKLLADWQSAGPLLMLWPYRDDVWRGQAAPVQRQLLQALTAIAQHHPVCLGVHPPQLHSALSLVPAGIPCFPIAYDDIWVRDIAPLYLSYAQQVTAIAGAFNGWQGINAQHQRDRRFARRLTARHGLRLNALPLVFEPGMLSHDGNGTAVVHGRSLQARNPAKRRSELSQLLSKSFGFSRMIWLENALAADETGGHTDNQLQFIAEDTIAFVKSSTDECWNRELRRLRQSDWAKEYRWLELPAARPVSDPALNYADVRRRPGVLQRGAAPLLCSYANLVRLPTALVVPQFGLTDDSKAVDVLQRAFPKLAIVAVDAMEFVRGGGGPHCLTATLPDSCRMASYNA
ncbi:agmatine deiminase family protein [Pseudidiomarina terrestris]|uniref:Agmatine deiminase family protein n=1 Tax=Pseudidiomarina terrestris TaxID=2820060 RepID=A0ABT8MK82_9GAMM|nr:MULTISPECIES: agmatine deiminase family protein [unclassified Pseudidiomarina]MDN7130365.1 agmatine deiminase family protein [Pseudidiomarina sp. 1APR75-15]MDN7136288.1 agmatine deiminase family protein [Pseudidiomarina sp. 1ASP75-5]